MYPQLITTNKIYANLLVEVSHQIVRFAQPHDILDAVVTPPPPAGRREAQDVVVFYFQVLKPGEMNESQQRYASVSQKLRLVQES